MLLKGIVFDLDGTLWHTEQAYIYAYHKLCDQYHLEVQFSDAEVEECLGIKADEVLLHLFPMVENQEKLLEQALGYTVEYLMAHSEDCCYDGVVDVVKELAASYPVFIVSNCLRGFAQAFMYISGTGEVFTDVYSIDCGTKTDNLQALTERLGGKVLYVGDCDEDYEAIGDHYTQYYCYAAYGYKPCVHYEYKVKTPTEILEVVKTINEKERMLGGKRARVISHGDNQLTLMHNADGTAYFGFTQYADDNFDAVVKELKALCGDKVIGPINGNTFYAYRYALNAYDWRLFPDCGGERELPIFLQNGFRVHQEYASLLNGIHHGAWKRMKRERLPEGYRVATYHGDAVYAQLDSLYETAIEAFAEAYLYEPISREDFLALYGSGLNGISPDLAVVYHGDTPAAFCFCYEDPLKRFYVCKTIAVSKAERQTPTVASKLIDASYQMMTDKGYGEVLHHFRRQKRLKTFSFNRYLVKEKRYALLEWTR